jgi:hypothetical protein
VVVVVVVVLASRTACVAVLQLSDFFPSSLVSLTSLMDSPAAAVDSSKVERNSCFKDFETIFCSFLMVKADGDR